MVLFLEVPLINHTHLQGRAMENSTTPIVPKNLLSFRRIKMIVIAVRRVRKRNCSFVFILSLGIA